MENDSKIFLIFMGTMMVLMGIAFGVCLIEMLEIWR